MATVGQRIVEYREKKGISRNKLAKLANISYSGLSSIEYDNVSPKSDTLQLIADALDCTVAELMGEDAETRPISQRELKFALFGGDSKEISDAQYEEVLKFVDYIKQRDQKKNAQERDQP